ncbi:MAG TPA: hypothetical protein VFK05_11875 [Polyangiaceae bacterium]|nr:hypothetical protein [Polyangiaceae bacterium]
MKSISDRVPNMFDNVRIRSTPATEAAGLAGLQGRVYGLTTPSHVEVRVIGESTEDCAYCIHFESRSEEVWLAPELVEFVDHAPGTIVALPGFPTRVRLANGEWAEVAGELDGAD